MRFIMNTSSERTHAPNPTPTQPTRTRQRRPDTKTITIRHATDRELLAPIFDADPNRSTHYLPPKLKGRILR